MLKDEWSTNTLLGILCTKPAEKIVAVKENGLADANFILTNLMKQAFSEENSKVCLVIMHNTLGHYQNIGKRLGYDFLKKIEDGHAMTIESLKMIADMLGSGDENLNIDFLSCDKEAVVKGLFLEISSKIKELLKDQADGHIYLIIDDISHLLDLGVDIKHVVTFLNYCTNLSSIGRISVVINCHVSNMDDEIISNALSYVADLSIEVSPLNTGISHDVTGIITLKRSEQDTKTVSKQNIYHYKAYDRGIRVFAPGESLFNLHK